MTDDEARRHATAIILKHRLRGAVYPGAPRLFDIGQAIAEHFGRSFATSPAGHRVFQHVYRWMYDDQQRVRRDE